MSTKAISRGSAGSHPISSQIFVLSADERPFTKCQRVCAAKARANSSDHAPGSADNTGSKHAECDGPNAVSDESGRRQSGRVACRTVTLVPDATHWVDSHLPRARCRSPGRGRKREQSESSKRLRRDRRNGVSRDHAQSAQKSDRVTRNGFISSSEFKKRERHQVVAEVAKYWGRSGRETPPCNHF
jgi:hypothetical protein